MKVSVLILAALLPCFAAQPQLKYVVIVTRHGVRAPTWSAKRLHEYSAEPWPDWGVPPGNLTPHGRALIKMMGGYYREWLASENLLSPQGCESAARITIYADKGQRTIETGKALAESLMPGCALATGWQHGARPDPLFSGTIASDTEFAMKTAGLRVNADLVAHHKVSFDALQYVLGSPKLLDLKAQFSTAATLGEDLLLEYANGMEGKNLGWGRLTKDNLYQILELHASYDTLVEHAPKVAKRSAGLLELLRRSIEQAVSGRRVNGAMGKPGDLLLVISGHDTNISNLSGLLGLSWTSPGYQPDDTPPGGALIFTLWQDSSGQQTVRLRYVAQSPDQMRNLEPGTPEIQEVSIPGCDPCSWSAFDRMLSRGEKPHA